MTDDKRDTLYYDGQCSLCAKEIAWLQHRQRGGLHLIDIHQQEEDQLPTSKSEMLKNLHLHSADGKWLIGLDATVKSWSHTPYGFIIKPLRWPLIRTIADSAYRYWAKQRYNKRYQCSTCSITESV